MIDSDNNIYFEQLFLHHGNYFREVYSSFACPTTPRLLVQYLKQVNNTLRWKEAVINQTLQF